MRIGNSTVEKKVPINKLSVAAHGANALLALGLAGLVYKTTQQAAESAWSVAHTVEVLGHISGVENAVAHADAAQRGFMLFAEDEFAAKRDAALADARARADVIRDLTRDNCMQQARSRDLAMLLERRGERMRLNEDSRRILGSAVDLRATMKSGREASSRIYAVTAQMASDERRLLRAREALEQESIGATRIIVVAAIVLFMGVIAGAVVHGTRSAAARRKAERGMVQLAESLPGAVVQYRVFRDGASRYELLSGATERIRGVDREAALRDPKVILDTILEPDRSQLLAKLAAYQAAMKPIIADYRARVGEQVRWIRTVAAPRAESDGSVVWSGHWDDVTTRRELEEQLRLSKVEADSANRAKSTFLATMSHEIRTPMNGALGMLELLALTRLDPEQRGMLSVVRESGRSLLRIIDDILDFSKVEAGKLDLLPEPTALREVVERVWTMYSGTASSKGLLLKRFFDQRISPLHVADPVRLQQILGNFVSNALKFTHAGGATISVHLVERKDARETVQFTVADSGIGLSADQQARLFTPFTQVHDRAAQRAGGTGLGLSIAQRLAALMGGTLAVESEIGRGTRMTFTVELGIADAPVLPESLPVDGAAAINMRQAPSVRDAERDGRLVLVVDDHPVNRMVLLKQVNALGYAGETAEDGCDASQKWSSGRFGAVITDCNMPEMSGYDLARLIRGREREAGGRRTVIIACTANALGGEADKCFEAGMDDYLAKPVGLAQLAAKLERWLPIDGKAHESAPRASGSDAAAPLDEAIVAEIAGGDHELARDLLRRFLHHNAEDARRLREAFAQGDARLVVDCAHRIKGAARTIGADPLARACESVEREARAGELALAAEHLPALEAAVAALQQYIEHSAKVPS
jgi:signal transduction histidine kinase/CheY-like chemotaxis protein/HPt (histidine-containing phosphotransfer) domain-containing protein